MSGRRSSEKSRVCSDSEEKAEYTKSKQIYESILGQLGSKNQAAGEESSLS